METLKTEISLLELQESKNTIKKKLKALLANPRLSNDYKTANRTRYEGQLKALEAQIEEWGTKSGIQYRIM